MAQFEYRNGARPLRLGLVIVGRLDMGSAAEHINEPNTFDVHGVEREAVVLWPLFHLWVLGEEGSLGSWNFGGGGIPDIASEHASRAPGVFRIDFLGGAVAGEHLLAQSPRSFRAAH